MVLGKGSRVIGLTGLGKRVWGSGRPDSDWPSESGDQTAQTPWRADNGSGDRAISTSTLPSLVLALSFSAASLCCSAHDASC